MKKAKFYILYTCGMKKDLRLGNKGYTQAYFMLGIVYGCAHNAFQLYISCYKTFTQPI